MRADGNRILSRLEELYECGKMPDGTHSRVAYTPQERRGRQLFSEYFRQLGITVFEDAAGNLIARLEGNDQQAPAIVIGSHLDTVLDGGRYDGVYGCVGGLEIVQLLTEQKRKLNHPLEIIVFADEEGIRFGNGMFGSSAFCKASLSELDGQERDIYGMTREEVLKTCGVDLKEAAKAARKKESVLCTLELHVEQGGNLDRRGVPIGVVTSIAGVRRYAVSLTGEANHSGSTKKEDRHDALVAAAKVIGGLPDLVRKLGEEFSVGTVGKITALPGAVNVIPGRCEFLLEFRDSDEAVMERLAVEFQRRLQTVCDGGGLRMKMEHLSSHVPGKMNRQIQEEIAKASERQGLPYLRMPSGAFHDSLWLTQRFPSGMIFVPSVDGISHSPREYTKQEDLENGVNVLLETVLSLDEKEGIEDEPV